MKKSVYFKSRGIKVSAVLSKPKNMMLNDFAIVFCHGLSSNKDGSTIRGLSRMLNRKGICTFAFDFSGHGKSMGKFSEITHDTALQNLADAIAWLRKNGFKRFGIYGSSFGGAVAVDFESGENASNFLVLKCPLSEYGKHMLKSFKTSKAAWERKKSIKTGFGTIDFAFFKNGAKHNLYLRANKIRVPALIVHGDKDATVPISHAKKLFSSLDGEKMMVTITGFNMGLGAAASISMLKIFK